MISCVEELWFIHKETLKCTWVYFITIKLLDLKLHWGYRASIDKFMIYSDDLWGIHCWKDLEMPILENISMYWKTLWKHPKYYHRINFVETSDFIVHIIVLYHTFCRRSYTSKINFDIGAWNKKGMGSNKKKKKNVPVTNNHRNHSIWIARFIEGSHASCEEGQ